MTQNLVQRLGTAALGLGLIIRTLIPTDAYAQTIHNDCMLPELNTAQYLGQKGPIDKLEKIPGAETIIKGYLLDNQQIVLYMLPNGKVYGYATLKDGIESSCWDSNGDGIFDQNTRKGNINLSCYGY